MIYIKLHATISEIASMIKKTLAWKSYKKSHEILDRYVIIKLEIVCVTLYTNLQK